jgi:hypothetical protein
MNLQNLSGLFNFAAILIFGLVILHLTAAVSTDTRIILGFIAGIASVCGTAMRVTEREIKELRKRVDELEHQTSTANS